MKSAAPARFHGAYRPEDVIFLLKPIALEATEIAEKERLIQTGQKHYSEMLSPERPPSPAYLGLFHQAMACNRERLGRDLLKLAAIIAAQRQGAITLVSLARAGTPIGVALKHLLTRLFGRNCEHYSVSIIRDRGLDLNALRYMLEHESRQPESIAFVDGWTGKGVIARELARSLEAFRQQTGLAIDPGLFVLADLAGAAGAAASSEDYLIPSSLLNATVSGLLSRSVLNGQIGAEDFHGCVHHRELAPWDVSIDYAEALYKSAASQHERGFRPSGAAIDAQAARKISQDFIGATMRRFAISHENLIKPGLGEATRVLLRRTPGRLLLRERGHPAVAHLVQLAFEKNLVCEIDPTLPYLAVSIIQGQHEV
jgi:hypothetical protein